MGMRKAGSISAAAFAVTVTVEIECTDCTADTVVMLFAHGEGASDLHPTVTDVRAGSFTVHLPQQPQPALGHADNSNTLNPATIDWIAFESGSDEAHHWASPALDINDGADQREDDHWGTLDAVFYETIRQAEGQSTPHVPVFGETAALTSVDPSAPLVAEDTTEIGDWLADYVTHAAFFEVDAPEGQGRGGLKVSEAPCVAAGTQITTLRGQKDVADLEAGDFVLTRSHGFRAVSTLHTWKVSRGELDAQPSLVPLCIKAGALGPGRPSADLWVSPNHQLMITGAVADLVAHRDEVFVTALSLMDGAHITRATAQEVTYHLPVFDAPETIYANGIPMACPAGDIESAPSLPSAGHSQPDHLNISAA